jgi:tetratricopeptide (TPR) repeat protein
VSGTFFADRRWSRPRRWLYALLLPALAGPGPAVSAGAEPQAIEQRLLDRLMSNPDDADSWRLLGRLRLEQEDHPAAREALERAVALDPLSAAAAFDLGRALRALDLPDDAVVQFERAANLAPDSQYALDALDHLDELQSELEVHPAGYEIRRFDASDRLMAILPPTERALRRYVSDYYLLVELGAQYNSNVALSPLSRGLAPGTRESFQAVLSPEFEATLIDRGTLRFGTALAGDFTLNEGNFQDFNLQSYRPGLFVEGDVVTDALLLLPRLDYEFGLDQFHGSTFATRNRCTASVTSFWTADEATILFWSVDYTDFRDDGLLPSVTSQDGWTNALGAVHEIALRRPYLDRVRGSVQFERADTTGSEFRYYGVGASGGAAVPLPASLELDVRAGWSYRDYPDFILGPARNEHIFNAGVELRRPISKAVTTAVVFAYDRFLSDNASFDAERVVGGVMLICEQ